MDDDEFDVMAGGAMEMGSSSDESEEGALPAGRVVVPEHLKKKSRMPVRTAAASASAPASADGGDRGSVAVAPSIGDSGKRAMEMVIELEPEEAEEAYARAMGLEAAFETAEVVAFISHGGYSKVGLQFPDSLLQHASPVCDRVTDGLRALGLDAKVFVMADTQYGGCCVDFTTAHHWAADAMVHFGMACLTTTSAEMPVLHVFPKRLFEPAVFEQAVAQAASVLRPPNSLPRPVFVMYDLAYHHALGHIQDVMDRHVPNPIIATPPTNPALPAPSAPSRSAPSAPSRSAPAPRGQSCWACNTGATGSPATSYACSGNGACSPDQGVGCAPINHAAIPADCEIADELEAGSSPAVDVPPPPSSATASAQTPPSLHTVNGLSVQLPEGCTQEASCYLWLGGESLQLTNLIMSHSTSDIYAFDPAAPDAGVVKQGADTNRRLMKRFHCVQQAMDATVVGILVATLSVANSRAAIKTLRDEIAASGRTSYTIVVGKLNVAKLANFAEVDVFCLVGCPLGSMVDSKEHLRPIVTPHELRMAFDDARSWTGVYANDLEDFVLTTSSVAPLPIEGEEEARVSLITGKVVRRAHRQVALEDQPGGGQLANVNNNWQLVTGAAATALQGRVFQGIEMRLGEDAIEGVVEGRRGIASGFEGEGRADAAPATRAESTLPGEHNRVGVEGTQEDAALRAVNDAAFWKLGFVDIDDLEDP